MKTTRVGYSGKMTPKLSAALLAVGILVEDGYEGVFHGKKSKDLFTRMIEDEVEKMDLELLPCLNNCGESRTSTKLFCSAKCCKDYGLKKRAERFIDANPEYVFMIGWFCPHCIKPLVVGEQKEYETLPEHVSDPNGESRPLRDTYYCLKRCGGSGSFYGIYGGAYGGNFRKHTKDALII